MLLTLVPAASAVCVEGGKYFSFAGKLYFKSGDSADSFTGSASDYNAAYNPTTGTLTLKNCNEKEIVAGGVSRADITIVLIGTNIINDGSIKSDMGGGITITSDSGEVIPFKEWTSDDITLTGPNTADISFTVPAKKVMVITEHSPFDGTPTFTPSGTTGTHGTLTFKMLVKPCGGNEGFRPVKFGDENDESKYIIPDEP